MKAITITLSDEAFSVLRTDVLMRHIDGNYVGPVDAFARKVVDAIENDRPELRCDILRGESTT
jgi:hypothetical protein